MAKRKFERGWLLDSTLWKRGNKVEKKESRGMCESTAWATRLRKSGRKNGCVSVNKTNR